MSINVSKINSTYSPIFSATVKQPENKFVQNAYAVQGNLNHPESRTSYNASDNRGLNVYYLA